MALDPSQHTPGQKRERPMQVLALGLPRTGTRSMSVALELLGYEHCAHGFDLIDSPTYTASWEKAVDYKYFRRGKPLTVVDWDELLGHCSSVTDIPSALFWRELHEAYPKAKIVLVQRDEDRWYKSFSEAVIESMFTPSGVFTRKYVEPLLGSRVGPLSWKILQGWLKADSEEGMKANARAAYRKHYEEIRAAIPRDQILDFELNQGWQPLCSFLGKDVPEEDFPFVNETDALKVKIKEVKEKMGKQAQTMLISRGLPIVAMIGVALLAWNMTR